MTVPLDTLSSSPPSPDARYIKRPRSLSHVAHGTDAERERAEAFLLAAEPYYGGKTHKHPHLSARWVRLWAPYHGIALDGGRGGGLRARIREKNRVTLFRGLSFGKGGRRGGGGGGGRARARGRETGWSLCRVHDTGT